MGLQDAEEADPNAADDDILDDDDAAGGSPDELAAAKGHFPGVGHPAHPTQRAQNPAIAQLREAMLNDRSGEKLRDARNSATDQSRNGALIAALAKSGAQIGSFHGHVADSSPVADEAKALSGAAASDYGAQADEVARRQKVNHYLLGGLQKRDLADANIDSREGIAEGNRTSREGIAKEAEEGRGTRSDAKVAAYLKNGAANRAATAENLDTKLSAPPKATAGGAGAAKSVEAQGKHYIEMVNRRNGVGRLPPDVKQQLGDAYTVEKASELLKGDLNSISSQRAALIAAEMEKVATGSAGTEAGRHGLNPNTFAQNWSNFKNRFTGPNGQIDGAQIGPFLQQNKEYLEGIGKIAADKLKTYRQANFKNSVIAGQISPEQQAGYKDLYPQDFAEDELAAAPAPKTPQAGGTANAAPVIGGVDVSTVTPEQIAAERAKRAAAKAAP